MFSKIAVTLFLLTVFSQPFFAQIKCEGEKIFSEKKCLGDEVNQQETELFRIVNEYRKQNNLPPVALSDSLSIVANRHLLDIILNIKSLTHGWSNCPYDIKNAATWNCVFESPKRLKVDYPGIGFENLYRNNGGNAAPASALAAWKKSALHNSLILNLNIFKDTKYDAFGVALNGQYAALWFGSSAGNTDGLKQTETRGLGVTFENTVKGLTEVVAIKKESSTVSSEQWTGASPDKSVLLEVIGTEADVTQATIAIKIKLEKNYQINAKNRAVLSVFLTNLAGNWKDRETWANAAIKNLQSKPKQPQHIGQGDKLFTMTVDANNYLSITVKPRPVAKEIK